MTERSASRPIRSAARLLVIACTVCLVAAPAAAQDSAGLKGRALVEALREGGFTLYFRHAQTNWSQNDRVRQSGDWKSCDGARMRQLSEQGKATARRVGTAIRRLGIPVGRILSSEYCRAIQTAEALGLGAVRATTDIMNMRSAAYVGGRDAVARRGKREIGRKPEPGTNTVIVAHGNLMRAATGDYVGEATAGVYRALGNGRFEKVAIIDPAEWARLAERFAAGE